jgi:hypothetical protein
VKAVGVDAGGVRTSSSSKQPYLIMGCRSTPCTHACTHEHAALPGCSQRTCCSRRNNAQVSHTRELAGTCGVGVGTEAEAHGAWE